MCLVLITSYRVLYIYMYIFKGLTRFIFQQNNRHYFIIIPAEEKPNGINFGNIFSKKKKIIKNNKLFLDLIFIFNLYSLH